jgi:hypothetical protein
MLRDFLTTGLQLTQMIGLVLMIWGVAMIIIGIAGNRGILEIAKGGVLMIFGAYVAGLYTMFE